jgi:hypothetical protein
LRNSYNLARSKKSTTMATYNDLKTDKYYLVKEVDADDVSLVYVLMETQNAVFLEFEDEMESMVWKKKSDKLGEIVEELTEEQADLYESIVYEEEEDEEFSWEDIDEDEDDDDSTDEDDDEDDDKTRKLFN